MRRATLVGLFDLFVLLLAKRYGLPHWKERWTNGDGATLTKVGTGKIGH